MIEVFAGTAVLCATSKAAGLSGSIAVDKVRKRSARCSIFQLNLVDQRDQALLKQWVDSPLLAWIHLAPVCGTASRAREIPLFEGAPRPLRSCETPEGNKHLTEAEHCRVDIANEIFEFSCFIFCLACSKGVAATMENPRSSYFWLTKWFLQLMATTDLYCGDLQVCMLGGSRDKWTRIVANFPGITSLNIRCDRRHSHEPWGFARDDTGQKVWATSLESQYPKKFCVALVNILLQFFAANGMKLKAESLEDDRNPLQATQQAQISAGYQPRPSRVPPVVADFSSVAVFLVKESAEIPCALLAKLDKDITLHTIEGLPVTVPKYSPYLRFSALAAPVKGGEEGQSAQSAKRKLDHGMSLEGSVGFPFEVAFGLHWTHEAFIQKACSAGHPMLKTSGIPKELVEAVSMNVEWNSVQMCSYRIAWCRRWVVRAKELETEEKANALLRHPKVAEVTCEKRILLTREMLEEIAYEDTDALKLLHEGATLAGEIEPSKAFQSQFKPCLATMEQLQANADKRNALVLRMTTSSGDESMDLQLLEETCNELQRGWAEGPFQLHELEPGATISRRFPLTQGEKTRLIDDFSVSGVNDSCIMHNKLDLHMIDTFCAMIKMYFNKRIQQRSSCSLVCKTYDLKSAYRQVPIRPSHYKFAYFSIFNCKTGRAEIYRLKTMPFGATHSVFCFLRLSRMLFAIATKGLYLLSTNFYDDFILAAQVDLQQSARCSMELLFRLTGWLYAEEGKKATQFSQFCKALGVEFDFSRSEQGILHVCNTQARRDELVKQISDAVAKGCLGKHETLVLRGRLGFADSFLHGRLGKLVLKKLVDHAYGKSSRMEPDLVVALKAMVDRLQLAGPRRVTSGNAKQWCIFTDASFEQSVGTGGIGGVLVDSASKVQQWFGIYLDEHVCKLFGSDDKGTIIYELELLAAVLATSLWCADCSDDMHVHFGDNDSVRFSLVRACASGDVAQRLMQYNLQLEAKSGTRLWFARVSTECDISDYPSRQQSHPLLGIEEDMSGKAKEFLQKILEVLANNGTA